MATCTQSTTSSDSKHVDDVEDHSESDDVAYEDTLPTRDQVSKAGSLKILDAHGNSSKFSSLLESGEEDTRHLIVFVRHFFCGLCQDYTRTLSEQIPPSSLPTNTKITIIGCGDSDLIPSYISNTECPYPMYSDPEHKIYDVLHMVRNLAMGKKRPDYQINGMLTQVGKGIYQTLASGTHAFSGGNHAQLGGEMLIEGGEIVWFHRMINTRNHTEVAVLKKLLHMP